MEEDEEWEYEYDNEETEDIYFTLDLTTHVPDAVPASKMSRNGKRKPKEVPVSNSARDGDEAAANLSRVPTRDGDEGSTAQAGKLQFLDLHTTEPLVKFNDRVYSCYWHTDLGTQFYVSCPGAAQNPALHGNVVDVIGVSQARLLGKPVTLRKRRDVVDESAAALAAPATDGNGPIQADPTPAPSDLSSLRPGQQLVIPRDVIKNPGMEAQASFFERLSAIKLKKGENDIIPVGGVRQYAPPANMEELRQKNAPATEVPELAPSPAQQTPSATSKRKKRTYAEMGKETLAEKKAKRSREALGGAYSVPPLPVPLAPATADASHGADRTAAIEQQLPVFASDDVNEGTVNEKQTPMTVQYSVPDIGSSTSGSGSAAPGGYMAPASVTPWHALARPSDSPSQNESITDLLSNSASGTSGQSTEIPRRKYQRRRQSDAG